MYYGVQLTAYVNGKNTGVVFKGKTNFKHEVIRFTTKHYQKYYAKVMQFCVDNNILTKEDCVNGTAHFDLWWETENKTRYVWSYYCSFGSNMDQGYFITSRKPCDIDRLAEKYPA